jgi:hypothetical protein
LPVAYSAEEEEEKERRNYEAPHYALLYIAELLTPVRFEYS